MSSSTSYPPRGALSSSPIQHTLGRDSLESSSDTRSEEKYSDGGDAKADVADDDEGGPMKLPRSPSPLRSPPPDSSSTSTMPRRQHSAHHRNGSTSVPGIATEHPGLATPTRILNSAGQFIRGIPSYRPGPIDPHELSRELLVRHQKIRTKDDLFKHGLIVVGLIASWYLFSTCISVYNKWMFDPSRHNFPFPVFVTAMHMYVQTGLSLLCIALLDSTGKMQLVPRKPNGTKRRPSAQDWATKVFPCALASALDIGLSNNSLKSITLTLYTMCKSSSLVFVLMFAFLFGLERVRCNLIAVIAIITAGVIMMVAAETQLVVIGAVQVLSASVMGGLRGALTQLLLEKEKLGISNPVSMILWICPIMGCLLLASSPVIESWSDMFANEEFHNGLWRAIKTIALLIIPGCLAFCMMLSEYALIQRTSVVTLSVAGIFKEVLTVIIASSVFADRLTPVNVTGLCVALLGIGAYNWIKWKGLNDDDGADDRGGPSSASAAGYERAATRDADDEGGDDDDRSELLPRAREEVFDADVEAEAQAAAEASRKRRQEEADMDGWASSGIQQVGGGYYDDEDGKDVEHDRGLTRGPL